VGDSRCNVTIYRAPVVDCVRSDLVTLRYQRNCYARATYNYDKCWRNVWVEARL